jgi:hypothetical protein
MTTASMLTPSALTDRQVQHTASRVVLRRLPAAVLGLLGAAALGYGVTQPWVSTFQGLITQSGWGTRNGDLLLAGAAVSGCLAVAQVVWATTVLRWVLALAGFATAAFAGYLLIQLYTVTQQTDSMVFLGKGPGLYISAAGAAAIFATIFLPVPGRDTPAPASGDIVERSQPLADDTVGVPRDTSLPLRLGLLRALHSPYRYPAAVLAVVAGLAHVPVTPGHLNEAPYIGVGFIVLTTVCVLLATMLLISDSLLVWGTLGTSCLLAVIAYVVSRSIGLPLMADDVGNWLETLGVVSVLTESGVVVLSALALGRARKASAQPPR